MAQSSPKPAPQHRRPAGDGRDDGPAADQRRSPNWPGPGSTNRPSRWPRPHWRRHARAPRARIELLDQRAESRSALADHAAAQEDAQAMLQLARRIAQPGARSAGAVPSWRRCRRGWTSTRKPPSPHRPRLAAARKARHRRLQGLALFRLSEAQFRSFDNAAALRHAQQAVAIFEALGDRVWQGRALWAQAYAHDQLGQARERERAASAALALARAAGDQEGIGAAANLLYREHADMALRLKGLKQSLAAFLAAGQKERAGASLGNLGMAYGSIGLYARARNPAGQALAMHDAAMPAPRHAVLRRSCSRSSKASWGTCDNARRLPSEAAALGREHRRPLARRSSCSWCSAAPRGCMAQSSRPRARISKPPWRWPKHAARHHAARRHPHRAGQPAGRDRRRGGGAGCDAPGRRAAACARRRRPGQHVHARLGLVVALARAAGQRPATRRRAGPGHRLPRDARRRGQPQRRGPAPQLVQQGRGAPPADPRLAGRRPAAPAGARALPGPPERATRSCASPSSAWWTPACA